MPSSISRLETISMRGANFNIFWLQQATSCKNWFSDYVSADVLLQEGKDGNLHFVAYFLRRIVSAKCTYEIYDKKLLVIIWCFKEWRPELESTAMPVNVLIDHKGLKYFMTIKKLTPRQTRWAEFLSKFNFVVTYQTRKKNNKADALIKKPNKRPANDKNNWQEYRMQTLLPPERIEIYPIEVTDQLEEYYKPEQHEVINWLKQQKSVEAEHQEKKKMKELSILNN